MNPTHKKHTLLIALLTLIVTALITSALALPAAAGPHMQDWTPIPKPTEVPVDNLSPYTLERVGGDGVTTRTFPGQTVNGVTFGETTVEVLVEPGPVNSMAYSVIVDSDTEIRLVDLVIQDVIGRIAIRQRAQWDNDLAAWQSVVRSYRYPLPVGTLLEFGWCMKDTADTQVCTDLHSTELWDPEQVWYRMENEWAKVLWYGFGDDDPEQIGRRYATEVEATHPLREAAFGRDLSYKFTHVLVPDMQDLGATGFGAHYEFAVRFGALADHDLIDSFGACPLYRIGDDATTEDWLSFDQKLMSLFSGMFLQYDIQARDSCLTWNIICANTEPAWWTYGHAVLTSSFTTAFWDHDQRLRDLAPLQSIRPLMQYSWGPWDPEVDGCPLLAFDVGASFVNWLIYTYGNETHRQIVELMIPTEDTPRGLEFQDAIEQATGKPFVELENEWRMYLELPSLD